MPILYHHTCTGRLPHILREGCLNLEGTALKQYEWRFLWATEDDRGDRTATSQNIKDPRERELKRLVRLTFDSHGFQKWTDLRARYPADQVDQLETSAREMRQSPQPWWCSEDPLPVARIVAMHHRSFSGPWCELVDAAAVDMGDSAGVIIDGLLYQSQRIRVASGALGYAVSEPRRV